MVPCVSRKFCALTLSLSLSQARKDGPKDLAICQAQGCQPEKAVPIPLRGAFQRQAPGRRLATEEPQGLELGRRTGERHSGTFKG